MKEVVTMNDHVTVLLKKLPLRNGSAKVGFPTAFEQRVDYPEQPSPIQPVRRIPLECEVATPPLYTPFLWKQLIRIFEIPYHYEHCFIQKLKYFIMDQTMMSFLGGRRAYPLLELLDQPRVQTEKKHLQSFGYFVSFLTNSKVDVDGEVFDWSGEGREDSILYFVMHKKWD